ncbi:MAG: tetratricopeptide repeat protein [Candidatus Manganitrophus sp.]|nr:MAG: tetratricopeptide repeat protein [Candidatus Manganitrophus sp.]
MLENGDYPQAEHKMNTFLKRYPKSRHLSALLIDLGAALDHQGKHPRAIKIYTEWLLKNPKHADQEKVSLLLAKAFRKKGDYRKEAAIYLKWIDHRPENAAELSFLLGDAYYRLREYQKAIQAYQTALKEKSETPQGDWIQLQIAKSHAALGQKTRGRSLFDQLARNAKDPLVRQMAAEAMATLNLRSAIDGNRRKEG